MDGLVRADSGAVPHEPWKPKTIGGTMSVGSCCCKLQKSMTTGAQEIRDCSVEDDGSWVTDA